MSHKGKFRRKTEITFGADVVRSWNRLENLRTQFYEKMIGVD